MRILLFVIVVLAILLFVGCAPAEESETADQAVAEVNKVVEEATSEFIDEADTVEIGEML